MAIKTIGDYPPDLMQCDTNIRLKIPLAGFLNKLLKKEFVFHDTFMTVSSRMPFLKPRNFPYSGVIAIKETGRGAVADVLFVMQGNASLRLKGIAAADVIKIRSLTGK